MKIEWIKNQLWKVLGVAFISALLFLSNAFFGSYVTRAEFEASRSDSVGILSEIRTKVENTEKNVDRIWHFMQRGRNGNK